MNTDLTQQQIDFYRENGYIVIEEFLTPDELETWRRHVDAAVAQRDGRLVAGGPRAQDRVADEESRYYDRVLCSV